MKTFTTYAEKKAKQFLNLLQGYTEGIRITAILILLLMGVSNVSAWDIGGNNVIFYYANTGGWSGINMYYWGDGWSSNQAFAQISNTKIYYYKFDHTWTNLSGIKFNQAKDNWNKQSSGDITGNLTTSRYWKGNETSSSTTLANLNGTAKVISKISTGGTYTELAKTACVATVSGYTLNNSATSASTTNASTGSASSASINAAYGSTITYKSNTPTGYTFKGFSTTSSTSLPVSLKSSGTTVTASEVGGTANTTYYAYYLIDQYTITYNLNGGTNHANNPASYTIETSTITLQAPTKADYTFEGWYTSSDFSGSKVTQITKGSTGNKTFYAKWTANAEDKYNVTAVATPTAGGVVTPATATPMGVTSGGEITATPNEGYEFTKWSLKSGYGYFGTTGTLNTSTTANTVFRPVNQACTIQATFTEIKRTIRVTSTDASYGTVSPTTVTAGVVTQSEEITATPEPGYEFTGWSVTQGSGKITLSSTSALTTKVTKALANGTITANFQEKKHNVTISYKSGNTNLQSNTTQSVGEAKATSITAPEHTGYTFTGWTLGTGITNHSANTTTNPISITTNSSGSGYTLTANYEKAKYTLTFSVQGGIGGSATATVGGDAINSPATFEHGTEITLTATADDKYAFIQWVDGSGASLSTANPYTHTLTATTTIQAVFANTDVLYLKPIDNWKQNNEWYAAYFYKEGTGDNFWVRMKNEDPCGGSAYYKTLIPDGDWTHVIFIRMDGSKTDLKWENKWDQTVDLTIPTDGKNCFTNGSKNNDKFTGSWSTHTPTNYEPVVFNVTVPPGTPNCYIIGDWDGWSQFTEMTKVDDTHYTVTMYDVCKNSLHYKYCYGPSWGCQEVKTTANSTQAVDDREYSASDNVVAWIKYCIVGYNGNWDWNTGYEFDINGFLRQHLGAVKNHNFKIRSSINEYYTTDSKDGEKHKFTRDHNQEYLPTTTADYHNSELDVDVAGYYEFHFNPVNKFLIINYPANGYQIEVTMGETKYKSNTVKNAEDIMSFFAPGESDGGSVQLYHNGSLKSTIDASTFKTSGVYTAKLNANKNGITDVALYEGNYYIRTDGANGGWNNYETDVDNKMTYFVPREREKYSYYWVAALPRVDRNADNGVVNVKACVANDYNNNLANMLEADKFTDVYGSVVIKDPSDQKREKINVRFGYNPKTNHFERAMLTGSGNMPNFLNITDPEVRVYKEENLITPLTEANSDSKFTDVSNWVYETNVWVDPHPTEGVTVALTATSYNDKINSLFGFEFDGITPKQEIIIGQSSGEKREMRVVYDFKTNRMIMAWIPGDVTISDPEALQADVLFIRHENDDVPQLKLTGGGMIKDIQSQFFALELENDANKQGGNKEHAYWISLPFDCVVGSISGVPGYMETWGIQRYNGEKRAEIGWFKETYTFWEWLTQDDVMKAGEGYVLSFDKKAATWNTYDVHEKDENGNTISTTQKSLLRLYFPSTKTGYLFKENTQLTSTYKDQPCEIERDNRKQQDSNWRIIATTSYYNAQVASGEDYGKDEEHEKEYYLSQFPNFRYTYVREYDKEGKMSWYYKAEHGGEGAEYKSFHSYMVQYAGTITWKALNESVMPAGLVARRNSDSKATNITTRLVIADAEDVQHDQTFVALDEKGTTTFDQNLDLNKIFNSGKANIYTLSEGIPFAGNTLPMEEVIVPVGVQIATDGEYTFAMPDGTEGMVVELIDYELETTTNLLLFDYTVTLPKGTNEDRFALHIQPSKSGVTTGVENVGDKAKGIEKYLIDGKLIIRTAEGVFDAQGHRL